MGKTGDYRTATKHNKAQTVCVILVMSSVFIKQNFSMRSLDTTLSMSLILRYCDIISALRWRHNDRDGVSNHQPRDCLLNRLFRRRSKETSKLCVSGLCAANSPGTGEFSAQMASYAENVSIWWCHHGLTDWDKYSCIIWIYFWVPFSNMD